MTRRLILHVGSPKCGSTYLQRVLENNRDTLFAQGINYPAARPDPTVHPGNGAQFSTLQDSTLEALFAGADTVVMSHEDLFSQPGRMAPVAARLEAAGVAVQVVVFLRPFSSFIFGDYSQFLKQNLETYLTESQAFGGQSFETFTVERSRVMTPIGWLRGWQRMFPALPLIVSGHHRIRPVMTPLLNEVTLDWEVPPALSNPSLRMVDCDELVLAINAGLEAAHVRDMYRLALHKARLSDPGKTAERTRWIEALFDKQNQELLAEFSYDNHLTVPTGQA